MNRKIFIEEVITMSHRMIVAVTICIIFISAGCSNKLHETIRELGYTPIALPSTAYKPGKVVSIVKNDPFQANTVCKYGSYIGSPVATKDEAASLAASGKLTNTFTLGADFLKQIEGNVDYSSIKDIKVSLTNVSVEEIPDNSVFSGLPSQLPDCTQAIQKQDRDHLGFLQNALKADATYNVTFDQKGSIYIATQQELLRGLALKLGVVYQDEGNNQISGKNLYWGVKPPNSKLVLTPLRITRLQLLDEAYIDRSGKLPVVTALHPRATTTFDYKNANDFLIAFLFTIEDFRVDGNSNIDIDGTISIQDSKDQELHKDSFLHFSTVSFWEQMSNVQRVGVEKVKEYLKLPKDSSSIPIPYIVIVDELKSAEIPNGDGKVVISITDKTFNTIVEKSLAIQVTHD